MTANLMGKAKMKQDIRQKIKRWLAYQPRVKVPVETILDYVYGGTLPNVIDDEGVKHSFIFHPPKATEFALLWAECWLSSNPDAEINNAEAWAKAVLGGNQFLAQRREKPPELTETEKQAEREQWEHATNGIIFECRDLEQAKAFAAAVKERWGLNSRVFDDAKAAARAHLFPWEQFPPVVHVDRPHWGLGRNASQEEEDKASAVEDQIEKLAEKTFGGKFVGT
jgi:hypothetical protein